MMRWRPFWMIVALLAVVAMPVTTPASAQSADKGPLQLEAKILLGDVRGRIDHMAADLKRQRLFIAELGNDSVGIVDLASRGLIRTITGMSQPQGVGYDPSTDTLFVANAQDGSVRLFEGSDYKTAGRIDLGSDADNVRIDPSAKRVLIGYGDGGLAVLDASARRKVHSLQLKVHPESFQIEADTGRVFINLPAAHAVAVVDGTSGEHLANWPMNEGGNFAMAVDRARSRILLAFRSPPELAVFAMADGKRVATAKTCGDVDDLFVDAKRDRVYVSCGTGFVDVFETDGTAYRPIARLRTAPGARTSLFVPEMDRLLVAVRAGFVGPAAIWMFRPGP